MMPRVQFQRRPRRVAPGSARAAARRDARLARQRHVGDGNEPSRQGLHRHRAAGRSRPARAAGDPGQLQGAVPAGRRHGAVRRDPDEPAARRVGRSTTSTPAPGRRRRSPRRRSTARSTSSPMRRRATSPRAGPGRVAALEPNAAYLHYTPNETIGGVEFHFIPTRVEVPLVADMSSTILSRPVDVSRFGLIYAGAQKNIGPAGLTVVIVRDDLLGRARAGRPTVLRLQEHGGRRLDVQHAAHLFAGTSPGWCSSGSSDRAGSTPIGAAQPGQGAKLYDAIDASGFYRNPVARRQPLAG